MMSDKRRFMAMIRRGQKLTGQNALAAAGLGLGELYRSENGDFALRTTGSTFFNPQIATPNRKDKPNGK